MFDIEKFLKLVEYVLKNLVAVVIGAFIGGAAITVLYEKFRMPSMRDEVATMRTEVDRLKSATQARPDDQYEIWEVNGAVDLESGSVPYQQIITSIRPPDMQMMPDGSFTAKVPVEVKSKGERQFPKLIFAGIAGRNQPVVHIWESGTAAPTGAKDYNPEFIEAKRKVRLKERVVFTWPIKTPYKPGQHAEKIGGVGWSAVDK